MGLLDVGGPAAYGAAGLGLFGDVVANVATEAPQTMLDMGTGGGEWLSSFRARAPITVATRGLATERCGHDEPGSSPLGVPVVYTEGSARQSPPRARGPGGPGCHFAPRHSTWSPIATRASGPTRWLGSLRREGMFLARRTHLGPQQFHELLGSEPPDGSRTRARHDRCAGPGCGSEHR